MLHTSCSSPTFRRIATMATMAWTMDDFDHLRRLYEAELTASLQQKLGLLVILLTLSYAVTLLPVAASTSTKSVALQPLYVREYVGVNACSASDMIYVDLGKVTSLFDCTRKASAWRPYPSQEETPVRCLAACWFRYPHDDSMKDQCYCLPDVLWMPQREDEPARTDSARLVWPCNDRRDCSYNGRCSESTGRCDCFSSWKGPTCSELNLDPVDRSKLGFREADSKGEIISSWGAPILWDEDSGKWHGWASEITNHCGINAWMTNSQIVHIVGDSHLGPFTRMEVIHEAFAHEPSVVRGPKGEWVMLFSSYRFNATARSKVECRSCANGTTPNVSPLCPFQRGDPKELGHIFRQMISVAQSANGPWSSPVEIPQLSRPWDWNTALTINADGSAVALLRAGFVWHAKNFSDPASWAPVGNEGATTQGPPWKGASVEDPFIWQYDGVYHALAHAFSPFYGVHAFAPVPKSSFDWNCGEPLDWTVTGVAYGNNVTFVDGSAHSFSRRERPHLVWAAGTKEGEMPIAISNGVQPLGAPNAAFSDGVFTLVQPLNGAEHEMMELQAKS